MVKVATPSKVCFPLVYLFFEVMLMSGIDGIRSCLEDYILLFLFDVCMYVAMYVCILFAINHKNVSVCTNLLKAIVINDYVCDVGFISTYTN